VKITHIKYYEGGDSVTKDLRWVLFVDETQHTVFRLILNKANDIVGGYSSLAKKIWIDQRWEEKYGEELRGLWAGEMLQFIPPKEFLLNLMGELTEIGRGQPKTCLHLSTKFQGFNDSTCPDCSEVVSPSLVMGHLLNQMGELNETLWEAGHVKNGN
jgi:hypothetical protein